MSDRRVRDQRIIGGLLMVVSGLCLVGNVTSGTTLMHPLLATIVGVFGIGAVLMSFAKQPPE